MSKAIAVLDEMPKSCKECKYGSTYFDTRCWLLQKDVYYHDDSRSKMCPLKPMPNKLKDKDFSMGIYEYDRSKPGFHSKPIKELDRKELNKLLSIMYSLGFNECREKILGEE